MNNLRAFRDAALIESRWSGRRRKIGSFTFGIVSAQWQTEENGEALLSDKGLRHNRTTITRIKPTTLHLFSPPINGGYELVTYEMDVDDTGIIEVFTNMILPESLTDKRKIKQYRQADRLRGLSNPTNEQNERLYRELARGASGLYPYV